MKRWIIFILISSILISSLSYAAENEMGHSGGISEGSNLPKTIEKYVNIPSYTTNTYQYKEVIFITGTPLVFEGTIEVALDDTKIDEDPIGSYTETYTIEAKNLEENGTLERKLSFTTYYRVIDREFKKIIDTESELSGWEETIKIGDDKYELDESMSSFYKSGIKDVTPGVVYYDTDVTYVARFIDGDKQVVTISGEGSNYGFDQPWSKIETQDRHITIDYKEENKEDMIVDTNATLESKKTIYYDKTEPYPISFDGTYNQRMEREGVLTYQIKTYHNTLDENDYTGSIAISTANRIEKLPIPTNLDFIEGHWAEDDIKKLYSMEIFTQIPHFGMQYEAISRGEFVKALCLAMNIDIMAYEENKEEVIFGDVTSDHPLYPYVMAAYKKKLIKGTGEDFDIDRPINRQEAFVIYIRVIGLERLGVTESPLTPFVDDSEIASWAKKEIMAGYKLGIIQGDNTGRVNPKRWISKSEAAAIVNRLIDYLREEIGEDYRK